MVCEHTNSKGIVYYLHTVQSPRGFPLYFFSKKAEDAIDLPEHLEVIESARSHLPVVRKKK